MHHRDKQDPAARGSQRSKLPVPCAARKLLATRANCAQLRIGYTTFTATKRRCPWQNIDKPQTMEDEINKITSVLENGIFARDAADVLILGTEEGAKVIYPCQG